MSQERKSDLLLNRGQGSWNLGSDGLSRDPEGSSHQGVRDEMLFEITGEYNKLWSVTGSEKGQKQLS